MQANISKVDLTNIDKQDQQSNNFTANNFNTCDVEQIDIETYDDRNENVIQNKTDKEQFLDSVSYNLEANKKLSTDFSKAVYEQFIDKAKNFNYNEGNGNAGTE